MKQGLQWITGVATLAWPLLVWLALQHNARFLLPLALLFLLRAWLLRKKPGLFNSLSQLLALTGAALCLASTLLGNHHLLLWYPVAVNSVMLLLFGGSLFSAMPLVERLARLHEPHLPPHGVRYTRQVTRLWCLFFIFNGAFAAFTCLHGDMALWTLWNGLLSYLLIGLLMALEWLVRQRVQRVA